MVFSYTNIKQIDVFNTDLGKNSFVNDFNPGQTIVEDGVKKLRKNYQKSTRSLPISPNNFTFTTRNSSGTDTTNNKYWAVGGDSGDTNKIIVQKFNNDGKKEFAPIDLATDLESTGAPSCEVDENGRLWIAYSNTAGALILTGLNTNGTTFFAATSIATGLQSNMITATSLNIDKVNGRIWIAYQKSADLDMYLIGRLTSSGASFLAETNINAESTGLKTAIGISNSKLLVFWCSGSAGGFLKVRTSDLDGTTSASISTLASGSITVNDVSAFTLTNNETWIFYQRVVAKYQVLNASGSAVLGETSLNTDSNSIIFKMKAGETPTGNLVWQNEIYNKTTRVFSSSLVAGAVATQHFRHSSTQNTLTVDGSQLKIFRQDLGFETGLTTNMDLASFTTAPKVITLVGTKTTPTNTTLTADVQAFDSGKEVISTASGLEQIFNVVRDTATGNYFGIGQISSTLYIVKWDSNLNFSTKTSIGSSEHRVITTDGTHAYIIGNSGLTVLVRKHLLSDTSVVSTNSFTLTGAVTTLTIPPESNAINFGGNFYFSCYDEGGDKKAFLVSVTTAGLVKNWEKSQTAGGRDYLSRGVTTDGTDLFHLVEDITSTTNIDRKARIFKVSSAGADLANALLTDTNSLEKTPRSIANIGTNVYVTGYHQKDTSKWFFAKLPTTLASETFNTEQDPITQGIIATRFLTVSGTDIFAYGYTSLAGTHETNSIEFFKMNTTSGAITSSNEFKTKNIIMAYHNTSTDGSGNLSVITSGQSSSSFDNNDINFTVKESNLSIGKVYTNVATSVAFGTKSSISSNTSTSLRVKLNLATTDTTVSPSIKSLAWAAE